MSTENSSHSKNNQSQSTSEQHRQVEDPSVLLRSYRDRGYHRHPEHENRPPRHGNYHNPRSQRHHSPQHDGYQSPVHHSPQQHVDHHADQQRSHTQHRRFSPNRPRRNFQSSKPPALWVLDFAQQSNRITSKLGQFVVVASNAVEARRLMIQHYQERRISEFAYDSELKLDSLAAAGPVSGLDYYGQKWEMYKNFEEMLNTSWIKDVPAKVMMTVGYTMPTSIAGGVRTGSTKPATPEQVTETTKYSTPNAGDVDRADGDGGDK